MAAGLLKDYFRCTDDLAPIEVAEPLSEDSGYFRFGPDLICYGQCSHGRPQNTLPTICKM